MTATPLAAVVEPGSFANALRRFRTSRRMSQLDLALACDVSARHLSFLESGRAQPSRDMVLLLADGLMLPLQTRNALLLAAGFAAVFPATPLSSEELAPLNAALEEMMRRHMPNPALLCDRYWNLKDANRSARVLLAPFMNDGAPLNLLRLMTDGPQAAALIVNLLEVIDEMESRLRLEALSSGEDPVLEGLLRGLEESRKRHPHTEPAQRRRPLTPLVLRGPDGPLSFLTAVTQFGTSEDITVRDLRLELFFPADDATRAEMGRIANARKPKFRAP